MPAPEEFAHPNRWAARWRQGVRTPRWAARRHLGAVLSATLMGLGLGLTGTTVLGAGSALAATPAASGAAGYDVSFPQCGGALPSGQAFGVAR